MCSSSTFARASGNERVRSEPNPKLVLPPMPRSRRTTLAQALAGRHGRRDAQHDRAELPDRLGKGGHVTARPYPG